MSNFLTYLTKSLKIYTFLTYKHTQKYVFFQCLCITRNSLKHIITVCMSWYSKNIKNFYSKSDDIIFTSSMFFIYLPPNFL